MNVISIKVRIFVKIVVLIAVIVVSDLLLLNTFVGLLISCSVVIVLKPS